MDHRCGVSALRHQRACLRRCAVPCCVSAAELAHAPWREGPKARRQLTLSAVAGHKRLGNSTELGWEGLSQNVGSASRPNGALYQQMYRFIMPPIAPHTAPTHNPNQHLAAFHLVVSISAYSRLLTNAVSSSHSRLPYPRVFSLTTRLS